MGCDSWSTSSSGVDLSERLKSLLARTGAVFKCPNQSPFRSFDGLTRASIFLLTFKTRLESDEARMFWGPFIAIRVARLTA